MAQYAWNASLFRLAIFMGRRGAGADRISLAGGANASSYRRPSLTKPADGSPEFTRQPGMPRPGSSPEIFAEDLPRLPLSAPAPGGVPPDLQCGRRSDRRERLMEY
jgi:hypothetical protein